MEPMVGKLAEAAQVKPFIALCMIIRDAEETIGKLLQSVTGSFDEYVFVDTGSVDRTREIVLDFILKEYPEAFRSRTRPVWPELDRSHIASTGHLPRFVLAHFDWIDDFAAARNYSFELATARWRGYLDADDEVPLALKLRPAIRDLEKVNPKVNSIVLPYIYETGFLQDKFRFMKWEEGGWEWRGEIHEFLFATKAARFVHTFDNLLVQHEQRNETGRLERNIRICTAAREKALAIGDVQKAALMNYYLGQYHAVTPGKAEQALLAFREASDNLDDNNIACEVRANAARLCLASGAVEDAMNWAALAVARAPEMIEGYAYLGLAHYEKKHYQRAAIAFDKFFSMPRPVIRSTYDAVFFDAIVPAAAAYTYTQLGRLEEAFQTLSKLSPEACYNPRVSPIFVRSFKALQLARSLQATRELWENLVWNDEPLKARALLDTAVPEAAAEHPELEELRRFSDHRLRHMNGWEDYKKCYAALKAWTYDPKKRLDTDWLRSLGRTKATREWAEKFGADGPPVLVLSIGPQEGRIERDVLLASPRIHLTVADASSLAEGAIALLMEEFPGRVRHHKMNDHYDWGEGPYDAIFFFEVLEHVPSDVRALRELRKLLADELDPAPGILFLSTPLAGGWTNPTLSTQQSEYDWWGHVRANSGPSLWKKIRQAALDGELAGTDINQHFLAMLHRDSICPKQKSVAIFVHATPTPFDPDSHLGGHLGGSEEAVIYLSAALARKGYPVTVYAPRPERADGRVIYGRNGVQWRPVDEFDFSGSREDTVLFWRAPEIMLDTRVQAGKYKKLLWLHDQFYQAKAEAYAKADGVIVLSKAHGEEIAKIEGFKGPFLYGANGIDLDLFPALTEEDEKKRDPKNCIYGSSPDRGLDRVLAMWPKVRAAAPDATLDIYYSWDLLEAAMRRDPTLQAKHGGLRAEAEKLRDQGVTIKGGVDQRTLAEAYRHAGVWIYPTAFPEIFCISAVKAQAAGAEPICTDTCALAETADGFAQHFDVDLDSELGRMKFAAAVICAIREPMTDGQRKAMSDAARGRFGWDKVASLFEEFL